MDDVQVRLDAIRGLDISSPPQSSAQAIAHTGAGSYLRLQDKSGSTYHLVRSIAWYLDVKWSNFALRKTAYWITELELFNLLTGETCYLEWERDDHLELSLTQTMAKMSEIRHQGQPLTRAALEAIAEEEAGEVSYQGVTFSYVEDDSWAGRYTRKAGDTKGIPLRAYEFASRNGLYLTIEAWHDGDDDRPEREAFLSRGIKPSELTVLQLVRH